MSNQPPLAFLCLKFTHRRTQNWTKATGHLSSSNPGPLFSWRSIHHCSAASRLASQIKIDPSLSLHAREREIPRHKVTGERTSICLMSVRRNWAGVSSLRLHTHADIEDAGLFWIVLEIEHQHANEFHGKIKLAPPRCTEQNLVTKISAGRFRWTAAGKENFHKRGEKTFLPLFLISLHTLRMTTHELLRSQRFLLPRRRRKERGREILAAIRSSWTYGMEFTQEWNSDLRIRAYLQNFPSISSSAVLICGESFICFGSLFVVPSPLSLYFFPRPPKTAEIAFLQLPPTTIPKNHFPSTIVAALRVKKEYLLLSE